MAYLLHGVFMQAVKPESTPNPDSPETSKDGEHQAETPKKGRLSRIREILREPLLPSLRSKRRW
jgi:hypothetical protein